MELSPISLSLLSIQTLNLLPMTLVALVREAASEDYFRNGVIDPTESGDSFIKSPMTPHP